MTRQHFELITAVIRDNREEFRSNTSQAAFAAAFAGELATTNDRFDRVRFLEACRPSWVVGTSHEAAWDRQIRKATTDD